MLSRTFHIVLAVIVYFSSLGFVLNAHYCKEELRSLSIYLPAKSCHDEAMADKPAHPDHSPACPIRGLTAKHSADREGGPAHCPMHQEAKKCPMGQENNCCDDHSQYAKQDQEQQFELTNLTSSAEIQAILSVKLLPAPPETDRRIIRYLHHKPPLLVCDLFLSLQTFLC